MKQNNFKRWSSYLILEIRKGIHLIPFFFITMAVTAAAVILAAVIFSAAMSRGQVLPKASVAVVCVTQAGENGALEDADIDMVSRLGIGSISGMKSVETIADIKTMKLAEAENGLQDGSVDAAVYITPNVYQDINTGVNTPITVRLGRDAASLDGSLFVSLITAGVRMLRTIEAAVYTPYALEANYRLTDTAQAIGDRIFDIYLKKALSRGKMWGQETVSAFGDLSIIEFYIISGIIFIIMLFGLGFASFYSSSERQVLTLLCRSGIPQAATGLARLIAIVLILLIFECILFIAGRTALLCMNSPEAAEAMPSFILHAIASALPDVARGLLSALIIALLAASLIHVCGQWIRQGSIPLIYTLIVIVLFVVTGGLLPNAYLPAMLRKVTYFSPVQLCQALAAAVLLPGDTGSIALPMPAAAYALLESALLLTAAYIGGKRHDK